MTELEMYINYHNKIVTIFLLHFWKMNSTRINIFINLMGEEVEGSYEGETLNKLPHGEGEINFKNHGFKLVKIKPMIFDSFYISLLSEEFKFGKKKFITSFLVGLYSNCIGLFTKKGYSSSIYVFKRANSAI